jgi:multidrug efflux pump subunit AcrA (membrane-fusion protein)
MKRWIAPTLGFLAALLVIAAWILYFHNPAVAGALPRWPWVQSAVTALGQHQEAAPEEDEDPDNTKNEIPVHTGHVTKVTLHGYIETAGTVSPRPQRGEQPAGSATIASPIAGIVSRVLCIQGQSVKAGTPLIQLDSRLAQANTAQAEAALKEADAALALVKAGPKPAQVQIAQLAIDKSQGAVDLAQHNYDRLKGLAADQGASTKSVEQAAQDLQAAKNDLATNQRQLALLQAGPTPEELAQAQAKVAQAAAALAAAKIQQELLTIKSPLDATIVSVAVNPGEAVDTTRPLVQLVAMDRLMVDVDVPADELPSDAQGLTAQIVPGGGAFPDTGNEGVVEGKVSSVSPQVDPKTGAIGLTIDLPPDVHLRPGLWVRVRIIAQQHDDVLAVPEAAVAQDENGDWVIATLQGHQATRKQVKVGLREKGLVEISADGLKEGDTVVTAGAYGLPQATRVKVLD